MRILCLGDSVMQYNDFSTYPQTGWIQELRRFFPLDVEFLNFARNGRSSKSFIAEGRFERVLKIVKPGDFAFIQFGHNDEKVEDLSRYTSPDENGEFRKNLSYFVSSFKEKGCFPILLTPVARRRFRSEHILENSHGLYPDAIKAVARQENIPCIDVTALTTEFLEKIGEKESVRFYMSIEPGEYAAYPAGKKDSSHLRPDGAFVVSSLVAESLKNIQDSFPDYKKLSESVLEKSIWGQTSSDKEIDDEFLMWC